MTRSYTDRVHDVFEVLCATAATRNLVVGLGVGVLHKNGDAPRRDLAFVRVQDREGAVVVRIAVPGNNLEVAARGALRQLRELPK